VWGGWGEGELGRDESGGGEGGEAGNEGGGNSCQCGDRKFQHDEQGIAELRPIAARKASIFSICREGGGKTAARSDGERNSEGSGCPCWIGKTDCVYRQGPSQSSEKGGSKEKTQCKPREAGKVMMMAIRVLGHGLSRRREKLVGGKNDICVWFFVFVCLVLMGWGNFYFFFGLVFLVFFVIFWGGCFKNKDKSNRKKNQTEICKEKRDQHYEQENQDQVPRAKRCQKAKAKINPRKKMAARKRQETGNVWGKLQKTFKNCTRGEENSCARRLSVDRCLNEPPGSGCQSGRDVE